jgi:rhomboid family protein
MLPFILIVAAIGVDRLLLSERWHLVDPLRRRWSGWRPRAIGYVRSAPATYVYLAVLFVTSWILQTSSSRVADALLQERSTNLHHLARDPLRVLLSSAFWVGSLRDWLAWVALLSIFAASVERWLGTTRTVLVFFIGHVGATLVTAAGLWMALRSDLVESSVANARDVGASYGFAAVAMLTYRLSGRERLMYAAALIAFVGTSLALNHNFTYWGHLIAVGIGFACYPLARPREDSAYQQHIDRSDLREMTADAASEHTKRHAVGDGS